MRTYKSLLTVLVKAGLLVFLATIILVAGPVLIQDLHIAGFILVGMLCLSALSALFELFDLLQTLRRKAK